MLLNKYLAKFDRSVIMDEDASLNKRLEYQYGNLQACLEFVAPLKTVRRMKNHLPIIAPL